MISAAHNCKVALELQACVGVPDLDALLLFHCLGVTREIGMAFISLNHGFAERGTVLLVFRLSIKLLFCFQNGGSDWLLAADPDRVCGAELWGLHLLGSAMLCCEFVARRLYDEVKFSSHLPLIVSCSAGIGAPRFSRKEASQLKKG